MQSKPAAKRRSPALNVAPLLANGTSEARHPDFDCLVADPVTVTDEHHANHGEPHSQVANMVPTVGTTTIYS